MNHRAYREGVKMGIYIDKDTRLIVQGITGDAGKFHLKEMLNYGTNVVAGVTPFREGENVENIPVFNSVLKAKQETDANASVIFVPARFAADAIIEAVDADLDFVVCITENIPVNEMVYVKNYMKGKKTRLLGPNCPGMIVPDVCKIGILPGYIHQKGNVGIVSRSGTLTYEAVGELSKRNIGQSAAVGIGGDPIIGTDFIDALSEYEKDKDTEAIVLIGEIGGTMEEDAADYIKSHVTKPVVSFISGQTAPKGKRMGHAGAIVTGGSGSYEGKRKALEEAGVVVCDTLSQIGENIEKALKK